jgi:cytochrome c oxidase subunit 4
MSDHIVSPKLYVGIFLSLMVLTLVTVAVTYVNLGAFNLAIAMAVAITKASLVILFFMHVKYSPKVIKVTVGMSFFFLLIMMMMIMSDYLTRGYMGMPPYPTATATGTASVMMPQPAKTPPAEGGGSGEEGHH